jgi:prepilin peptidase CpaA
MLIVAATGIAHRTIPNWLTPIASRNPLLDLLRMSLWPSRHCRSRRLAVFLLFAIAFRFGAMGGGDVKMVAALALWLPWERCSSCS